MRDKLLKILKDEGLDIITIFSPKTIGYFTNVFIDPHERVYNLVATKDDKVILLVPKLDEEIARQNINIDCEILPYLDTDEPYEMLLNKIGEGYEKQGSDRKHAICSKLDDFEMVIEPLFTTSIDQNIEELRINKTMSEVQKMQKAAELADECMKIAKANLKEGMTEIELKLIIEMEIKKQGVQKMAFETIVLFGENASKPHGTSSMRRLKKGDFVLLDLGCEYDGYASDETRVLEFGETTEFNKKIYDIVLKANTEAIKNCSVGKKLSEIDKIARDIITKEGYGEYFTHRLGHGIGLDCHEFPDVSSTSDTIITEGMVFTIEPGIYIPNKVGVRIEDMIYMSKEGAVVLTKTEK